MTVLTAVAAKIEPYTVSDEALEVAFAEAAERFGVPASVADEYSVSEHRKAATLAAMMVLSGLRTLGSENVGGLSTSYNYGQINAMIKALARAAGLSPSLVGVDAAGEPTVTSVKVW